MKNSIVLTLLFPSCLMATESGLAQGNGAISGTVVDDTQSPVAGAKVNVEIVDNRPTGAAVRYVETDSMGHFVMDRLAWGTYRVFAKKEAENYPDMSWSFYSNDVFPVAVLTPRAPTTELFIQLGPKAATLVGTVTNAASGAPLNAGFKLQRSASPEKWVSLSAPSTYRVLLPASTDVTLEVSAPRFKTWSPVHALRLQPGAELHLDIELEPVHDPSLRPSRLLVPEGYTGWVRLEHDVKDADPVPLEDEVKMFKFPETGILYTSSPGPQLGAEDEYCYYSRDGSKHPILQDYRGGKGMIWGQYQGSRGGVMTLFGFFVGTEEQYNKYQSQSGHPGPIPVEQVQPQH